MPKKLILVLMMVALLFFTQNVFADEVPPSVVSYTLNGSEQNAIFNPNDTLGVEITINADEPVKFTRIKVKNSDGAEVKFFTSTSSFVSTVTKTWDGKNAAGEIVPDGVYTLEVNIKDAADNSRNNLALTPYTITLDISADLSSGQDEEDNDEGDTSSGSSSSSSSPVAISTAKIRTEVSVRTIAYVGIPLAFQGKAMKGSQQLYKGKYFWNFGDGEFRETKVINTDSFTHTYFYPGDYLVSFEYYPNVFAEAPEASQQIDIKVITPTISISRVGDGVDFFTELSNNTNYDVDISSWLLLSTEKSFSIPKNTILSAGKKMIISGRTSGFSSADKNSLKLVTPDRGTVFEYFTPTPLTRKIAVQKPPIYPPLSISTLPNSIPISENLPASSSNFYSSPIIPLLLFIFISTSAGVVYLIRQRKTVFTSGNDFEIVDE